MENKIIEQDSIIYCIKEEENGSFVVGYKGDTKDIFIPRSIKYETKEYDVLGILEGAFKFTGIKSIQFANDSKLQTIEKNAFYYTGIQNIRIPSSVTLIRENAFNGCRKLESIEIPNDSKLKTIEKYAFIYTKIQSIRIPSELTELKEEWCCFTSNLTKIEVSPKNPRYCCFDEKMIIGKKNIDSNNYNCLVFCVRNIEKVTIPNFIEHICSCSFDCCEQLESIEFSNDSKIKTIDNKAFQFSSIKNIKIPLSVILIGESAFCSCKKLESIEIPNDSKIQTIDKETFIETGLKRIRIPSSIISIGESAFAECEDFESIEITDDSNLQTIEKDAFNESAIESIIIPSKLIDLKERWCSSTHNLTKIEVSPKNPRYCCYEDKMIIGKTNLNQSNYDCLVFCVRNIVQITIPNFIEHICSSSFDSCYQLELVEFANDSKLQTIGIYAFNDTAIKSIIIPSSVTFIGGFAFEFCEDLEYIEIPDDSKLQTIGIYAFNDTGIKSIIIPSSVTFIGEGAFYTCKKLNIIEIRNTEMISMYQTAFKDCQNSLLMIPFHL